MYPESNGVSHQQDLPPLCSVMGRNYHYDNNCCIEPSLMLKASSQHKPTSMSIDANNDGGGSRTFSLLTSASCFKSDIFVSQPNVNFNWTHQLVFSKTFQVLLTVFMLDYWISSYNK